MAGTLREEMTADTEAVAPRSGAAARLRGLADWIVVLVFFLLVSFAALPLGANRDWAWAPLSIAFAACAVAVAAGLGSRSGFAVVDAERKPLMTLVGCFAVFVLFSLFQMSTLAPLAGSAWLYESAERILGSAHAPVPAIAIDAARNTLLKCLTCGAIFLTARAMVVPIQWNEPFGIVFAEALACGTPVMAVSDARIISRLADYTVFIVQWAKTPREVVKTALAALVNVSNHVGVVINRVNLAKHVRYGYGDHGDYYSRYRGYYGSGADMPAGGARPALKLAKK